MTDSSLNNALAFFEHRYQRDRSSLKTLQQSHTVLSQGYRHKGSVQKQGFTTHDERLSYLLARFPATYAACQAVLKRLHPELPITSMLDLGCGPGTASLTAHSLFPALSSFTLIEQDQEMLALAKGLLEENGLAPEVIQGNLLNMHFTHTDLVMLSYVLTEFQRAQQLQILEKTWEATQVALVVIIPGALKHFEDFLTLRDHLIRMGAHIAAPCPNHLPCPMADSKDWCHFKARVQRTSIHRKLKQGTLNYEDEPYSYLIATRPPTQPAQGRIIKRPLEKSGHVILDVCTEGKLERKVISRKDPSYKSIKKLSLGDELEMTQ